VNFRQTLLLSILIIAVGVAGIRFLSPAPKPLPVYGKMQPFNLQNQHGKEISEKDLLGNVWTVNAFFTSCSGPCPLIMSSVANLQNDFKNTESIRFVSMSVDPERDTPSKLASYGEKLGADSNRWLLLTGEKGKVNSILLESFKLSTFDDPQIHTTRIVLLDKQNQIRGYYLTNDKEDQEKLRTDIKDLLRD